MKITIKNWAKFQHYKDRNPPWIKLHKDLLNNRDYLSLGIEGMAIAPLIWLLASELSTAGTFEIDHDDIVWRLRIDSSVLAKGLQQLVDKKFIEISNQDSKLEDNASKALAGCEQVATPEERREETETEAETETETEVAASKIKSDLFEEFWEAVPTRAKRSGKSYARKAWDTHVNGSAVEVIAAIKLHAQSIDWLKEDGKFVPMISTWLNQKRWTAPVESVVTTPREPPVNWNMLRGKE